MNKVWKWFVFFKKELKLFSFRAEKSAVPLNPVHFCDLHSASSVVTSDLLTNTTFTNLWKILTCHQRYQIGLFSILYQTWGYFIALKELLGNEMVGGFFGGVKHLWRIFKRISESLIWNYLMIYFSTLH